MVLAAPAPLAPKVTICVSTLKYRCGYGQPRLHGHSKSAALSSTTSHEVIFSLVAKLEIVHFPSNKPCGAEKFNGRLVLSFEVIQYSVLP